MTDAAETEELISGPRMPAHLYVHVPFCRSKCAYCDFYSLAAPSADLVYGVFAGIEAEIARWSTASLPGVVETVYVGGGTPSAWPAQVASVLEAAREGMVVRPDAEVTAEANPDSLSTDTLGILAEAGVSRVSVGVQSFDDRVLLLLGRRHDAARAAEACEAVAGAGLELSVDLMCGVPGQTPASWAATLERVVDAGARHASVYPLALEEGTPLAAAVSSGLVEEPDADVAAEMMSSAEVFLQAHGLARYEVANYAVPGHESRHNTAYWTGRSYIGVGPAAHGMLDVVTARVVGLAEDGDEDAARVRYGNVRDAEGWLTGEPSAVETLTRREAAREDVMLGLRLVRGVTEAQVTDAGLIGVLDSLASDGLVERLEGRWRTTHRGWLLGNEVFGRVWNAK